MTDTLKNVNLASAANLVNAIRGRRKQMHPLSSQVPHSTPHHRSSPRGRLSSYSNALQNIQYRGEPRFPQQTSAPLAAK